MHLRCTDYKPRREKLKMKTLIPKGVDLSKTYKRPTSLRKVPPKQYEDLNAYFLGMLVNKCQIDRKPLSTEYPLHRDILVSLFGNDYTSFLRELEVMGVLSIGDSYRVNDVSKSYALRVSSKELVEYEITNERTIYRIKKARLVQLTYTLKAHPHLIGQYQFILGCGIDTERAIRFVREEYQITKQRETYRKLVLCYGVEFARELFSAFTKKDAKAKKRLRYVLKLDSSQFQFLNEYSEKYRKAKKRIHEIQKWNLLQSAETEKEKREWINLKVSTRTGRVFSNMTSTPRDLRQFLNFNGEPLVEIDANNAQWALLTHFLKWNTYNDSLILDSKKEVSITNEGGQKPLPLTTVPSSICVPFKKELEHFSSMLMTNWFVTMMHQQIVDEGRKWNTGGQRSTLYRIPKNERETKYLLLKRVLFENPSRFYLKNELVVKVFQRTYPSLFWYINHAKTEGWRITAGGIDVGTKPFSALALRLQKMEAELFTQKLRTRLSVPHCTIHDAVIVTKSNSQTALNAIGELISEYKLPMGVK